jgi:AGZA family xanthine/uracil permease-like MFS transporter
VEGAGAVVGGATSSSSNTVFIESGAGIEEGARTGLANLVTGVLFLVAAGFVLYFARSWIESLIGL